jgi:hypothetical protein
MRADLGCGWNHRPGWTNKDSLADHEPDVLQLPFEEGTANHPLAQDVLGHSPRMSSVDALKEWARAPSNEGVFELGVSLLFQELGLMKSNAKKSFREMLIHDFYGIQACTGDFHITSFTDFSLIH